MNPFKSLVKCDALRNLVSFVEKLKNMKNTHRGVFTSNTFSWVFFMFFKLYKWYQIALSVSNNLNL